MDYERAEQIVESLGVINVTYENSCIWLEYVEKERGIAHIKVLETGEYKDVLISSLKEERNENIDF